MGIELLLTDYYLLLKLMYQNEVIVLNKKVIPLTQQEIAETLCFSKMKVNAMFILLQEQGYIEQQMRGKYVLTKKTEIILDTIEEIDRKVKLEGE